MCLSVPTLKSTSDVKFARQRFHIPSIVSQRHPNSLAEPRNAISAMASNTGYDGEALHLGHPLTTLTQVLPPSTQATLRDADTIEYRDAVQVDTGRRALAGYYLVGLLGHLIAGLLYGALNVNGSALSTQRAEATERGHCAHMDRVGD